MIEVNKFYFKWRDHEEIYNKRLTLSFGSFFFDSLQCLFQQKNDFYGDCLLFEFKTVKAINTSCFDHHILEV